MSPSLAAADLLRIAAGFQGEFSGRGAWYRFNPTVIDLNIFVLSLFRGLHMEYPVPMPRIRLEAILQEKITAVLGAITGSYRLELVSVESLTEGNSNESYSVSTPGGHYIIRLAHLGAERSSLEAAMLNLERHYSAGSNVVAPLRSASGALVECVRDSDGADRLVTVLARASGRSHELIKPGDIPDAGFRAMGASLSRFHENSLTFQGVESTVPNWHQTENCYVTAKAKDFPDALIARRYRERMDRCLAIAESPGKTGIVHGDIHFSNVIYDQEKGTVAFCDFDNACVGPFALDVALLLFDLSVIVQCPGKNSEIQRLGGLIRETYRAELRGVVVEPADVLCFVDLLEASIYIDCLEYWKDSPGSEGWLQLFFEGRRERLAQDTRIFTQ